MFKKAGKTKRKYINKNFLVIRMKIGILLKNIFRAIISPHKVFKEIENNELSYWNYWFIIPLLAFLGSIHRILHVGLAHHSFHSNIYELIIKEFSIGGVYFFIFAFLFGPAFFYTLVRILKKPVFYKSIEIGIFYILMTVLLMMPVMDLFFHFFLGFKIGFLLGKSIHAGAVFGFIIIPLQIFFLSKDTCQIKDKKMLLPIILVSFLLLFVVKFFYQITFVELTADISMFLFTLFFFIFIKKSKLRLTYMLFLCMLVVLYIWITFFSAPSFIENLWNIIYFTRW